MSILITGGAGYIGAHCTLEALRTLNVPIVVYDDLSTGYEAFVPPGVTLVRGRLQDEALLTRTLQTYGVTTVMHFAASIAVGESVQDPQLYYENNVLGTFSLLRAMRTAGVETLIFSSTCAIYGEPQYLPLDEAHPIGPLSPYGNTKWAVEQMLADYSRAYPLRTVALRYFNAAGADPHGAIGEAHEPETHLIPLILQAISGVRPDIQVLGTDYPTADGTCIRDYVHVLDIAQAHILAYHYLQAGGRSQAFNIGSETGHSVLEVIEACQAVTGQPVPVRYGDRRPGDSPALIASAAKLKATLGWAPTFADLTAIVETAWHWEQKSQQGIPRLNTTQPGVLSPA